MSYHGLPYIISNLTMWTIGMLKDFRIGSCMRVGDMVYKFTLGMKHPVCGCGPQSTGNARNDKLCICNTQLLRKLD